MATRLRLLTLCLCVGLTGCTAYGDAARNFARAVNPDIRRGEALTEQWNQRQQHPYTQECLCPPEQHMQECLCTPPHTKSPR